MFIYKPYHLLLLVSILLFIRALLSTKEMIDIHVHDTYIVTTFSFLYWILVLLTYFLWGIYVLTRNILFANVLTWVHVILTVGVLILFICVPLFNYKISYLDLSPWTSFNKFNSTSKILAWGAIILILVQLIFIVNIVGGMITWRKKRS